MKPLKAARSCKFSSLCAIFFILRVSTISSFQCKNKAFLFALSFLKAARRIIMSPSRFFFLNSFVHCAWSFSTSCNTSDFAFCSWNSYSSWLRFDSFVRRVMVAVLSDFSFDAASRSALSSAPVVSAMSVSVFSSVLSSSILAPEAACTSSMLLAKRSWCPDIISWYVASARVS